MTLRFHSLLAVLIAGAAPFDAAAQSPQQRTRETYVIVHGAWGGSWAFRQVDSLLTAQGHRVYRPSLTGQGERAHLASPEIDLDTHIQDVVNVLLFEELRDVVLVGHSYGGMVVTGVADRVPERIRRVVYLDAMLPRDGESVGDIQGAGGVARLEQQAQNGFIVPGWVRPDQAPPKDVPQSLKTFTQPISLNNPAAARIPGTYILTLDPGATTDAFSRHEERARDRGYTMLRMEADHNPQWSKPVELAEVLGGIR